MRWRSCIAISVVDFFIFLIVMFCIWNAAFRFCISLIFRFVFELWYVKFVVGILKLRILCVLLKMFTRFFGRIRIMFVLRGVVEFVERWWILIISVLYIFWIFEKKNINCLWRNDAVRFGFSMSSVVTSFASAMMVWFGIFTCRIWWCCRKKMESNIIGKVRVVCSSFVSLCFLTRIVL